MADQESANARFTREMVASIQRLKPIPFSELNPKLVNKDVVREAGHPVIQPSSVQSSHLSTAAATQEPRPHRGAVRVSDTGMPKGGQKGAGVDGPKLKKY